MRALRSGWVAEGAAQGGGAARLGCRSSTWRPGEWGGAAALQTPPEVRKYGP